MKNLLSKFLALFLFVLIVQNNMYAQIGTWTKLTNNEPNENMGVMLLLTDGTVICHNNKGGSYGTGWDKLTPNAQGSYAAGTWSSIASMNGDRLFFASQVLPSGKVWVTGGEYGTGTAGEVYDPVANTWTLCGALPTNWNAYDAPSQLLCTGNVLLGPEIGANGGQPCNSIEQWNPTTLAYTTETAEPLNHDEAAWLKLPDSSVLTIGMPYSSTPDLSNRYRPQTNTWVNDANTPNDVYDLYGYEAGCALLLPNGKGIFFGSTQYNELYTPSGTAAAGTWANAANMPTISGAVVGQVDAPGAMMINGHILLAVSPGNSGANDQFRAPIWFVEYNYATNTFTQVTSTIPGINADSVAGNVCNFATFLDLPNGQVLFALEQSGTTSKEYWVYTPNGSPIAAGKPTINSIIPDGCPLYKITGKLFNGISEGAAFGDDWQMSTNYPLVRCTNAAGDVYYCKTTNWNRIGAVMTDSLEDTAVFTTASLPAGTYSLVVVVNGFASNPTIFTTLQASMGTVDNILCNGGKGTATVSVTGGISPYTYSWTGSGGSGITGTGLSAGTYTVTVHDANDCVETATVVITQPATKVTASATVNSNASCAGNTGSASSTVSGGISPYTYSWTNGGTNSTVSGLSAGSYTLDVTDNNGCAATASITITQATTLGISANVTGNIQCNGASNGSLTATASGGASPYTYSWAGGQTNATATGLSAGTYTIEITDNSGCSEATYAIITQPTALAASSNVISNTNCSGSTGSASSTVSGGVSPYTYSWTGGGTNSTINGLSAGTYILDVTDNNGCTASSSITITQSTGLSGVSANTTANVNCNGASDGSASSTVSGGTGPYTYSWTSGGTNATANGLSAGTYIVTITDNNGCSGTASAIVTQPALLSASGSVTSESGCTTNNGSASSTVSGGTLPYTYSWTGGGSNSTVSGLSAGTYVVDVTDNNGCTASSSVTITQTSGISSVSAITSNVKCNGENNGSATATVSGGTTPYTYAWQGGGTSATDNGLSAGTYTLSVTDKNGCSGTTTAVITQPKVLTSTTYTAAATNSKDCDGEAAVTASGGTTPYTYSWSGGGATTDTLKNACAGNYCCTITDNNGCIESTCVTIPISTTGVADINNTSNINIYPQPNTGSFTIAGVVRGQIIELYNILGQQISSVTADQANVYFNIANQADGVYLVRILNRDGSLVTQKKIVKAQ